MEPKVGSLKLTKFSQTDLDKWGKTQITKIRNKSGGITIDLTEIKIITREYNEQLYTNKLDNLDEASENTMAPHSSTLAWKIPWTEEPGRLQSMGSLRVGHDWATSLFHFSLSCIGGGNGNPLQRSCLENPRDCGAWWAAVYGVAQSWTRLNQLSSDYITSSWRLTGGYSFCPLLMPMSEAFSISFIL